LFPLFFVPPLPTYVVTCAPETREKRTQRRGVTYRKKNESSIEKEEKKGLNILFKEKLIFKSSTSCRYSSALMQVGKILPKRPLCRPLICHVCGDTARGMNFDVITCMSCKAFFRRHVIRSSVSRYVKEILFQLIYIEKSSMSIGQ
jgi:hypothetical protein